jgi:glycosyltransferase involved in cell wall biosynthesis
VHRAFTPLQIEQCELSERLPTIRPSSGAYSAARVLVRLDSHPVGQVDVPLPATPDELRAAIESALGEAIERRRAQHDQPGPADPPPVTVVIPTRDHPELLRRCLDSVLACHYPSFDVIVADNAPSDSRTRELVDGIAGVGYLLVPRPGSASARNEGARRASGEIVAFVDDDAVVDRRWLAELAAGFAPGVACVTGLVLAAELDTWAQQLFEEYGGFGKGFEPALYDLGAHRPDHPVFPFNPGLLGSGNNVAFRRHALLELGGYDPHLGNGTPTRSAEDWELFLRLLRRGRTAAYRPGAIVHHTHRRELGELRAQLHDYGVGLAAALTRTVLHEPAAALEIARRLPAGARFLLSARSSKNRAQGDGYPRELRRAELAGIARGPAAYLRSRRARGR